MMKQDEQKPVRRILVVEDEPFIAMGLEQLLPKLGYEVVSVASHLREALTKAEAGGFDLAILDVNLSGELSYRVADVLLARGVPFIFCTAYADVAFGRYTHVPVLQKPFDKKALSRAIEEALTQAPPSRVA
jgi:CheY-like chemotaxis protein